MSRKIAMFGIATCGAAMQHSAVCCVGEGFLKKIKFSAFMSRIVHVYCEQEGLRPVVFLLISPRW